MSPRYVAFDVGGTRYALPVSQVREIVAHESATPVPRAPSFIEGLINLHGEPVCVLCVGKRLGVESGGPGRRRRVIVAEHAGRLYGLRVDDVREILDLAEEGEGSAPADTGPSSFTAGVARLGDESYRILSLPRLLEPGDRGGSP